MEWYAPITILPGVGFLILSTSNFLIALNSEIMQLCEDVEKHREIINAKIVQVKRLSFSLFFLYASILSFLLAGLCGAVSFGGEDLFLGLMVVGVFLITIAIIILLVYSIKAIGIRQKLLELHS